MEENRNKKKEKNRHELITLAEASALTGYAQEYLNLRCRQGRLQGVKKGRNWYTSKAWISEFQAKTVSNKKGEKGRLEKIQNAYLVQLPKQEPEKEKIIRPENISQLPENKAERKPDSDFGKEIVSQVVSAIQSAEEKRRYDEAWSREMEKRKNFEAERKREEDNALLRNAVLQNAKLVSNLAENINAGKKMSRREKISSVGTPAILIAFMALVWFVSRDNNVVNLYNNAGKNIYSSSDKNNSSGAEVAGTEDAASENNSSQNSTDGKEYAWINSSTPMTDEEKKEVASTVLDSFGIVLNGNDDIAGDLKIKKNGYVRLKNNTVDSDEIRDHSILARDIKDDITLKVKNLVASKNITASGLATFGNGLVVSGGNVLFSTSGTITQSGLGQVAFAGNVDAANGLDVTSGEIQVTDLAGIGNRCLYVDANGVVHAKLVDCGVGGAADNLGDHIMTQNLQTSGFWISNDGGNEGIWVKNDGNVGVGNNNPLSLFSVGPNSEFQINNLGAISAATGITSSGNISFTALANDGAEATGVFINGANQLVTREFGSLAFSSATYDNYSHWHAKDAVLTDYQISSSDTLNFLSADTNNLTVALSGGDDADENINFTVNLNKDLVAGSGLAGGADNVLVGADSDVTISHSTANGYIHIPADGASAQILQYSSAGTAKWITLSTDATIADGGAVALASGITRDTEWDTQGEVETIWGTTLATDSELHPLLTLAGAYDYLSLNTATQVLTLNQIDISDDTNLGVGGTMLQISGDTISLREGTLTNGRLCSYVSGTGLVCDTESTGTGHSAVTLAGAYDYLSLNTATQVLTLNQIDISDDTNLGVGGTFLQLSGDTLSLREGTMTIGRLCTFNALGQLECNTESTGAAHSAVTLAGLGYLTLSDQQITAGAINIGTTQVTGTLGLANGGTGLGTTNPGNGTLLIGNGTGYTLSNLTAGTGIQITNGAGAITINATSGSSLWTDAGSLIYPNNYAGLGILDTGFVGIGYTNPASKLTISGGLAVGTTSSSSSYLTKMAPDGGAIFEGNVGIGTTNPGLPLEVRASSSGGDLVKLYNTLPTGYSGIDLYNDSGNRIGYFSSGGTGTSGWPNGNAYVGTPTGASNKFFITTEDTPRLSVNSSGYVGIGTTNSNTALEIAGANVGGYGQLTIRNTGVSGGPGIVFYNDLQAGIRAYIDMDSVTNVLRVINHNNGSYGALSLNSYGGSVGIGTTNPHFPLEVIASHSGDGIVKLMNTSSSGFSGVDFYTDGGTRKGYIAAGGSAVGPWPQGNFYMGSSDAAVSLYFTTQDLPRLTILPGGNVGIGTTNPSYKLQVAGTLGVSGTATFTGINSDGSEVTAVLLNSSNQLVQRELGSNAFSSTGFVDTSGSTANYIPKFSDADTLTSSIIYETGGNIGIGTTNPGAKLGVIGDANISGNVAATTFTSTNGVDSTIIMSVVGSGQARIKTDSAGRWMSFADGAGTIDSVVMRGGNLGVGTTNPTNKLEVIGNASLTGAVSINGASALLSVTNSVDSTLVISPVGSGQMRIKTDSAGRWMSFADGAGTTDSVTMRGGYLGVGTTNPTVSLTIRPASDTTQLFLAQYNDNTSGWKMEALNSGNFDILRTNSGSNLAPYFSMKHDTGNVGIGITNPSGYANAKVLDVYGANTANIIAEGGNGTNFINIYTGTNSADLPSIYFNQGLRFGSATSKDATGYSERMRITTGGNVGIGWTSPASKLTIAGSLSVGMTYATSVYLTTLAPDGGAIFEGNVGIGTTNPGYKLQVSGGDIAVDNNRGYSILDTSGTARYILKRGAPGTLGSTNDLMLTNRALNGDVLIGANGGSAGAEIEAIRIKNTTGNVGIGTSSPGEKFVVSGGRSSLNTQANTGANARNFGPMLWTDNLFGMELGNNGTLWTNRIFTRDGDGGIEFGKYPTGSTTNVNQFSPWMTIINSGNVGIGTSNPSTLLTVSGNTAPSTDGSMAYFVNFENKFTGYNSNPAAGINFGVKYNSAGNSAGMGGITVGKENATDGNYGSYLALHTRANGQNIAERFRISSIGNVGIGTTNPVSLLTIAGNTSPSTDGSMSFFVDVGNSYTAYNNNPVSGINFGVKYNSAGAGAGMGGITVGKENATDGNYSSYLALHTRTNGQNIAERFRISSVGYVGIGTTTPTALLTLGASNTARASVNLLSGTAPASPNAGDIYSNGANLYFWNGSSWDDLTETGSGGGSGVVNSGIAGQLAMYLTSGTAVSGTNDLFISGTGSASKIGIGTTNPGAKLEISGGSDNTANLRVLKGDMASGAYSAIWWGRAASAGEAGALDFKYIDASNSRVGLGVWGDDVGGGVGVLVKKGGNVGIGTTNVNSLLTVNGRGLFGGYTLTSDDSNDSVYIEKDGNYSQLHIYNTDTSNADISMYLAMNRSGVTTGMSSSVTTAGVQLNVGSNHELRFGTNNTQRMVIQSGGNIGIGTTNPSTKFHVVGTAGQIATVESNSTDATSIRLINSSYPKTFDIGVGGSGNSVPGGLYIFDVTSSAFRMAISTTGNVGIGFTSPGSKLTIRGGLSVGTTSASSIYLTTVSPDGGAIFEGNVGIGITSPGAKLVVSSNTSSLPAPPSYTVLQLGNADSSTTRLVVDTFGSNSNFIGRRSNGTAASPSALSANDAIVGFNGFGYGATGYTGGTRAGMTFYASQNWTDSAQGTYTTFVTTPDGSTTVAERMRLNSSGYLGIGWTSPGSKLTISGGLSIGTTSASSVYLTTLAPDGGAIFEGRVGIGITNPGQKLEASGNIYANVDSGDPGFWIRKGDAGVSSLVWGAINTGGSSSNRFAIGNNTVVGIATFNELLTILNGGNVGIGFTAPGSKLAIRGGLSVGTTSSSSVYLTTLAPDGGAIFEGKVGIGTTNPGKKLTVVETANGNVLNLGGNYSGYASTVLKAGVTDAAGTGFWLMALSTGQNADTTGGTNQFFVRGDGQVYAAGNVGIGTTNPSTFKLEVAGSVGPTVDDTYDLGDNTHRWRDLYLGPASMHIGTSTSDEYVLTYDTTSNFLGFNVNGSGNPEIVFDSNGYIGIGTTNPGLYSLNVGGSFNASSISIGGSPLSASQWTTYGSNIAYTTGNVGIGFTSPGSKLTISGGLSVGTTSASSVYLTTAAPDGGAIFEGNVGIGTTNPTNKLEISAASNPLKLGGLAAGDVSTDQVATVDADGVVRKVTVASLTTDGSPAGTVTSYTAASAPTGWLLCRGQAVSRETYADLFAVIGTTYGVGDGSTTFNLPNLQGKLPVGYNSSETEFDALGETGGEKTHTLTTNEIPSHSHLFLYADSTGSNWASVVTNTGGVNTIATQTSGSGAAHNNLQPYITLNYIIKYTPQGSTASATTAWSLQGNSNIDDTTHFIGTTNAQDLVMKTNNAERMRVSDNGYVGIGFTSPGSKLTISGGLSVGTTSASSSYLAKLAPDGGALFEGNVGIGTTNPSGKLHIGDGTTSGEFIKLQAASGTGQGAYIGIHKSDGTLIGLLGQYSVWQGSGTSEDTVLAAQGSRNIILGTNASERLRVDSSGNVGIGMTSPGYKLDVNGIVNSRSTIYANSISKTASVNGLEAWSQTAGSWAFLGSDAGGGWCGYLYGNGAMSCSSDERIKKNIQDIADTTDPLGAIMALHPVTFTMKQDSTDKIHLGFLAQEVQKVFPTLVSKSTSIVTPYTPDGSYSLSYEGLIAPLVGAVQQQQGMINEQSSTNSKQEEMLAKLNSNDLTVDDKISFIGAEISSIKTSHTASEARIITLETKVASLEDQMALLDQKAQSAIDISKALKTNQIDTLGSNYNFLATRFNELTQLVAGMEIEKNNYQSINFWKFDSPSSEVSSTLNDTNYSSGNFSGTYDGSREFREITVNKQTGDDYSGYDLDNGFLTFDIYMENADLIKDFVTEAGNQADEKELQWNKPAHPYFVNGWNQVKLPLTEAVKSGEVDFSNLNYFRVYFQFSGANNIAIRNVAIYASQKGTASNQAFAINGTTFDLTSPSGQSSAIIALSSATQTDMSALKAKVTDLEQQLALMREQSQAVIDFAAVLETDRLVYKDTLGNLNLGLGKLEADGVVAGAFTVKVNSEDSATMGDSVIYKFVDGNLDGADDNHSGNNGKDVWINTKAITSTSRVFVTPRVATKIPLAVTDVVAGEKFKVETIDPVAEDIEFDWWIVEEKQ